MGITYIDADVENFEGDKATLSFLVDSGAGYSLLPKEIWKKLGLKPNRDIKAVLADGTVLNRKVSDCVIQIRKRRGTTPVILGESGDEALLGVVTLENLGFVLNPFRRTLHPLKVRI